MRPFDFMVQFWGKRYHEQFVDLCLPSLLAPNNLALLRAEDGHQFLIATTRNDWAAIEHLPIMQRIKRHATPTWVEVGEPSTEAPAGSLGHYSAMMRHQNYCQKKLLETAYPRRTYGSLLFPDHIFSDFMVASLIKRAEAGYRLVAAPLMRQVEERVLDDLKRLGYVKSDERASMTAECISVPQRVLADLAVKHLHPEMFRFDQSGPVQPFPLPLRHWPVAGNRGLIMHTFFVGCPVMIDLEGVPPNHTDCLKWDMLENIYFSKNFSDCDRIHVVQDSDEFSMVSLTPESVNWARSEQVSSQSSSGSRLQRLANIRHSMWSFAGQGRDTFRRDLFRHPVRCHGRELDKVWHREERRIERQIQRAVGDYYKVSAASSRRKEFPSHLAFIDYVLVTDNFLRNAPSIISQTVSRISGRCTEAGRRLKLVLRGDEAAKQWLMWRIEVFRARLSGNRTLPPRPDVRL